MSMLTYNSLALADEYMYWFVHVANRSPLADMIQCSVFCAEKPGLVLGQPKYEDFLILSLVERIQLIPLKFKNI